MNADVFIGYVKAFVQINNGRVPTEAEWNDIKREMNNALQIGGTVTNVINVKRDTTGACDYRYGAGDHPVGYAS